MKLLLIRHGEAVVRRDDSVLTPFGLEQAKELAKKLEKLPITKIYCSGLTRAKQTCEELLGLRKDLTMRIDENLNEIYRLIVGGPEKEGTSKGREERDKKRAEEILNNLLNEEDKGLIAVFCHGNIIRYFIAKLNNKNPKTMWDYDISPATAHIYNTKSKTFEKEIIGSEKQVDNNYYL